MCVCVHVYVSVQGKILNNVTYLLNFFITAYKNGPQMAAVKLMLDRVTGSSYHHESKQEYMLE